MSFLPAGSGDLTPCSAGSELEFEDDETVHASHSEPVNITRERPCEDHSFVHQESPGLYLESTGEVEGKEQSTPVLTVASSFTDSSSIQRGFVISEDNLKKK